MTKLEEYYNKFKEENRLTTRHGIVEFNTSMHYIHNYLPEPNSEQAKNTKILDIGAGTGRYSQVLCEQGYDVTAVELVKHNLDILRAKHLNIKTWQGNAMDLNFLPSKSFDLTLLFGPMYHLHSFENKVLALQQAKNVTKIGGYILVAYVMNDYAVLSYCFKEHNLEKVIKKNGLTADFHTNSTEDELYDYVRLKDIEEYNKACNLKRIKIIAPDGPADYMRRELNQMSEQEFHSFLDFQLATCEYPELLGASSHTVDILQVTD